MLSYLDAFIDYIIIPVLTVHICHVYLSNLMNLISSTPSSPAHRRNSGPSDVESVSEFTSLRRDFRLHERRLFSSLDYYMQVYAVP